MQEQLIEILKIFCMSWVVGVLFSGIEYSNIKIKNPNIIRGLFIIKNKPVPLIAFIWQILNWSLLCFATINKLLNILTYEYTMYIYYNVMYYCFYTVIVLMLIDAVVYEFRK